MSIFKTVSKMAKIELGGGFWRWINLNLIGVECSNLLIIAIICLIECHIILYFINQSMVVGLNLNSWPTVRKYADP